MSVNERIADLDRLCALFVLENAAIIQRKQSGKIDNATAYAMSQLTLSTLGHLRVLRYALKRRARRKVKLRLEDILASANISTNA